MDTPNKRLARVLRLLADVIERDAMSVKADEAIASVCCAYSPRISWPIPASHLEDAERLATEAARLAGVPLDGWYTSEPPMGVMCLVTSKNGFLYVGKFDGSSWSVENFLDLWPNEVAAWRPLPEPYRPEEKTDEQR